MFKILRKSDLQTASLAERSELAGIEAAPCCSVRPLFCKAEEATSGSPFAPEQNWEYEKQVQRKARLPAWIK